MTVKNKKIELSGTVILLVDLPEFGLKRGLIGTATDEVAPNVIEVEFRNGVGGHGPRVHVLAEKLARSPKDVEQTDDEKNLITISDHVSLNVDLDEFGLRAGLLGTVVDEVAPGVFDVEFANAAGALVTVIGKKLVRHHEDEHVSSFGAPISETPLSNLQNPPAGVNLEHAKILRALMRGTADSQPIDSVTSGASQSPPSVAAKSEADSSEESVLSALPGAAVHELRALVGIRGVKDEIISQSNFLRLQLVRKERGLSVPKLNLHLVFTGNPGTGKTTVARIIGKIYKDLGILSSGHLVETDRGGLVGGFLGQTALKVHDVVKESLGGVLFIDEAYTLQQSGLGGDAYGKEAIDALLKLMEDHRHDLVVIVAGYPDRMAEFINSNPGLQSRFNKHILFADYSPEELREIYFRFAEQYDYRLTASASDKILAAFHRLHADRDDRFGNARLARNMFERTLEIHANRLACSVEIGDDAMSTLCVEDVPDPAPQLF